MDPDGLKIDGVGSRNGGNSVGHPLPEWKANANINWVIDRHMVNILVSHIDSYEDDIPASFIRSLFVGNRHSHINSFTTVDVQYNYQLPAMAYVGEGSSLTLGVKNAGNREAPFVNTDGGFDAFTHDPRGRMWYAKYNWIM